VTQGVDASKDGAADCLLLLAQMVAEKLMPSDVASIHARDGVVHEELGVDFRDAGGCRNGAKSLPKIIAPLGELTPIFLRFGHMP
jgi:hypothetical protein